MLGKVLAGGGIALVIMTMLVSTLSFSLAPTTGMGGGGNAQTSAVAQAALQLTTHLSGADANAYNPADAYMQPIMAYWKTLCHTATGVLCPQATSGDLQCVYFVAAAQWLAGNPLPTIYNAEDFWPAYAHEPGWQEIPVGHAPTVGDLIVWQGGRHLERQADGSLQTVEYGHIAVVVDFQAPTGGHNGSITIAQADAVGSLATLTVFPNETVQSWPAFTFQGASYSAESMLGYLQATDTGDNTAGVGTPGASTDAAALSLPAGLSPTAPYVQEAWMDAEDAGIAPGYFVRQIQQESNFNPNAVSSAGAIGIAQFLPSTAAGLGFDPHDPHVSLAMAAEVMAQKQTQYGNYAQALAAYNAGDGALQHALARCGSGWLDCLPTETQQYVTVILQ